MDEKVLIKGELSKKQKSIMTIITVIVVAIAVIMLFLLFFKPAPNHMTCREWLSSWGNNDGDSRSAFDRVFGTQTGYTFVANNTGFFYFFAVACLMFLFAVFMVLFFLAHRKYELLITDKNVRGKTLWGKEVVLPLYMVSAYSTKGFMSTITIATSSGMTKFSLMKNYAEIGKVLSEKINQRQDNTEKVTTPVTPPPAQNHTIDDIAKLKTLLDQGVITQEEFDAKKKQILGL